MKKWSEEAWEAAGPAYEAILALPFIKQLADGSLPREIFDRYIGQDSLYIHEYCKVLCHIASRLDDAAEVESFIGFASDGVAVEKGLHSSYITDKPVEKSAACTFYTSVLKAQAYAPVAVEAAAILPCFWVYNEVGKYIVKNSVIEGNPYADWIKCYSDPAFDISNARAIEICDRLAADADAETRRQMTSIFVEATRLEWLFWNSAYEDLKWKI